MSLRNVTRIVRGMVGAGGMSAFRDEAEAEVQRLGDLIDPGQHAVERLDTAPPGRGVNVMIRKLTLKQKLSLLPVMVGTLDSVTACGEMMRDHLEPERSQGDTKLWAELRQVAIAAGASSLGYTRISEHDIFQDFKVPYRNALVFGIEMDKDAIDSAPGFPALREVLLTYGSLGQMAITLTEALRTRGYGAYPGFPIGGLVDYVRLAEDAGLGAIGYHGMLISPEDGSRVRLNVVFTNLELDANTPGLLEPADHEWVRNFCDMCRRCVRECPPQALYTEGTVAAETGRKPTLKYDACLDHYAENHGCAVCVRVCPFSQKGYDVIRLRSRNKRSRRAA